MNKLNIKYDFDIVRNDDHTYQIDDIFVPGVTTILQLLPKTALLNWAVKLTSEEIKDKWKQGCSYPQFLIDEITTNAKKTWRTKRDGAGDIGTTVHGYIEDYINTGVKPILASDEEQNCFRQFLDWEQTWKPKWLATELVVASQKLMFAGTLDAVAEIGEETCLIDFKTSNGIYESHYIQTAAYQMALEESNPVLEEGLVKSSIQITKRYILRLDKKGKNCEFRLVPTPFNQDFLAFKSLVSLYKNLIPYKEFLK